MTIITEAPVGFDALDNPSEEFIAEMRRRYPTERETEELLARVVEEGMDGLSREERRRLEGLAEETKRRW